MIVDNLDIVEIGESRLSEYSSIPMAFEVKRVLQVRQIENGWGGIALDEVVVEKPYVKNCILNDETGPEYWPKNFDMSGWGIYLALIDSKIVGGVTVVPPARGLVSNERRTDTAALWDLRVMPEYRRNGIGRRLLDISVEWTKSKGFDFLAIETMNVDVPACRLYKNYGCELSEIRRFAYEPCAEVSHEAMLIWRIKVK